MFAMPHAISSSPAMLFGGGEALCYLDCCSICVKTIIICLYLIRIVISFICDSLFFLLCVLACKTGKTTPTQRKGKNMWLDWRHGDHTL